MSDEVLHWPRGTEQEDGVGVDCRCAGCAQAWRVHPSMAGFRFTCVCGRWIDVPAVRPDGTPIATAALPGPEADDDGSALPAPKDRSALPRRRLSDAMSGDLDLATDRPAELANVRSYDGRPLRRDPDGEWTLRFASVETQRRHNDASVLWIAGLLACFYVPALLIHLFADPQEVVALFPAVAVASGLLVIVALGVAKVRWSDLLAPARFRYFAEAVLVAATLAVLALGWVAFLRRDRTGPPEGLDTLRSDLGLPMALFVISLCPGIFEELAFRGVIQPRLALHFGRTAGALMGGAAFALGHGVTLGFPFHVGIGLWLSFLKDRSGSLLPGMLAHALYNGIIVCAL